MRFLIAALVLFIASPAFAHCRIRCHVRVKHCCITQVAAVPVVPAPAPVVVPSDGTVVQEKTTIRERRKHVEHHHRGETIVAPEK